MERYELPKGWEWMALSQVAPIDTQAIWPKEETDTHYQYIALENIESGTGNLINFKPTKGVLIRSNKFKFDRRHVLLGKLRPYLNKIFVPDFEGICATDILPLRPDRGIISREFFAVCLMSPNFVEYSKAKMEGTKIPRLRTPDIENYKIPTPPLPEQRRIVKRIEELTRRVEESRKLRAANLEDISRLLLSAMETCFQGDDDWIEKPLNELCVMKTGKTPPTSHPEYFNGDVPFVCPADVGERLLISDAQRRLSIKAIEDRKATVFEKGTVLLVCIGSTIGKVGLSARRLCTNQQITGLVFNDGVLPEYAAWFLTQQRETVRNAAAGGGVPIINQNGVGQLSMRFPEDKAEQRRIVVYLNSLQAKAEELKQLQTETEAELAAFTPALLAKAFRGEL